MKTGKEFVLTSFARQRKKAAFKISPTVCTTFRHEFHTFLRIILSLMSLQGLRLNKVGIFLCGYVEGWTDCEGGGEGWSLFDKKTRPSKTEFSSLESYFSLSHGPYVPARAFIVKLLGKSPYEGRTH